MSQKRKCAFAAHALRTKCKKIRNCEELWSEWYDIHRNLGPLLDKRNSCTFIAKKLRASTPLSHSYCKVDLFSFNLAKVPSIPTMCIDTVKTTENSEFCNCGYFYTRHNFLQETAKDKTAYVRTWGKKKTCMPQFQITICPHFTASCHCDVCFGKHTSQWHT